MLFVCTPVSALTVDITALIQLSALDQPHYNCVKRAALLLTPSLGRHRLVAVAMGHRWWPYKRPVRGNALIQSAE